LCGGGRSGQVEDLRERDHPLIGSARQILEQGCHLGLPAGIDLGLGHGRTGSVEVLGLQVADDGALLVAEQGVVVPTRGSECRAHLRPDGGVPFLVLRQSALADLQDETDPLEVLLTRCRAVRSAHKTSYKSKSSTLSSLKPSGGPSTISPSVSIVNSPSSPAVKDSPSAPVICPALSAAPV